MSMLNNVSIRSKIAAVFLIVLALVSGMGTIALLRASATNDTVADLAANYVASIDFLNDMETDAAMMRSSVNREFIVIDDKDAVQKQGAAIDSLLADYKDKAAKYAPTISGPEEAALYREMKAAAGDYGERLQSLRQLIEAGNKDEARAMLINTMSGLANRFVDAIKADVKLNVNGAGKEAADAQVSFQSGRLYVLLLLTATILVSVFSGVFLVTSIANPVKAMTEAMRRLAGKDISVAIPARDRGDELGLMAQAVDVFKQSMIETDRLRGEQEALKAHAAAEQKAALNRLADRFETKVGPAVGLLASGSTELKTTAQTLSNVAGQSSRQAAVVATAAEEASAGVQTVASAAEELSASIGEISRQVAQSAKMTKQAVADADRTDGIVRALSDGAQKIGAVVELITNIAGQTNLLALNATIEAARAGDAGKGFAVVASEVKNLATQTAKATDEIATQIQQIQNATKEAVEAIGGITRTIDQISATATTIASAVEQQGAATSEIARNVQQTSQATGEVTHTMSSVSQSANDTGSAAGQVLEIATDVSKQAALLRSEVDRFVAEVRAA